MFVIRVTGRKREKDDAWIQKRERWGERERKMGRKREKDDAWIQKKKERSSFLFFPIPNPT